jgi:hypothetical protein
LKIIFLDLIKYRDYKEEYKRLIEQRENLKKKEQEMRLKNLEKDLKSNLDLIKEPDTESMFRRPEVSLHHQNEDDEEGEPNEESINN